MKVTSTGRPVVGQTVWFEYHCWESDCSADAELWHHSHQRVKITRQIERGYGKTFEERADNGALATYDIVFEDGFKSVAVEDELCESPGDFCRPDPPKRKRGRR